MTGEEQKDRANVWRCVPVILCPSHIAVTLFKLWNFMLAKTTSITGQWLDPEDFSPCAHCPLGLANVLCSLVSTAAPTLQSPSSALTLLSLVLFS